MPVDLLGGCCSHGGEMRWWLTSDSADRKKWAELKNIQERNQGFYRFGNKLNEPEKYSEFSLMPYL